MTAITYSPRRPRFRRPSTHRSARAVAVALLLTVTACGEPGDRTRLDGTVHIGGKIDQPGFALHSEHTDRGFEVDLAAYLGEQIGFKSKFHDVVSAKRERTLIEGESELVIATYSITPERDETVDFVGPYFVTRQGFLVAEDYQGIKGTKDVAGKSLCTVEGSTSENVALPPKTTLHMETDYSTCVRKVQQGDVDAVFTDEALLYGYVEQHKNSKAPLKVVPDVSYGSFNRYGIGLQEGWQGDCKKLRNALRTYLTEEWARDVKAQLPALVDAYPGTWENRFRPDPQDLNKYSSCEE
ncbi:transporter substrate-binding domain-containing protein [Streptomyces cavernicola]|uniref:Transporter substrate-binding domain-containing protein n=1 Tax=Streptomyces cavernicola TaxID=3043613 RepID=A0ABT6SBQ5_9ACTN|nr:transporter substrate-binding domain-containing protein [Streptomyces sp. B-S-A6]MDI3405631.1 transporter substrate-binding domain-containing protein [Streptomyces sp. B-S-A6]